MKSTIRIVIAVSLGVATQIACNPSKAKNDDNNSNATACVPLSAPTFFDVQASISTSCGPNCHDGSNIFRQTLTNELGLTNNASGSLTRLQQNLMPPAGSPVMDPCKKQNLVNYLLIKTGQTPAPVTCTPIAAPVYSQVSATVFESCATASCHSFSNTARQDLSTETGLKLNKVNSIIKMNNGTMPPTTSGLFMDPCKKQNLLNYLNLPTT